MRPRTHLSCEPQRQTKQQTEELTGGTQLLTDYMLRRHSLTSGLQDTKVVDFKHENVASGVQEGAQTPKSAFPDTDAGLLGRTPAAWGSPGDPAPIASEPGVTSL